MIEKKYIEQINNKNLIDLLLKKEKVSLLEDLLDMEGQRLKPLLEKKDELELGEKIRDRPSLERLVVGVKNAVDIFLDTKDVNTPKFNYFNIFRLGLASTPILAGYFISGLMAVSAATSPVMDLSELGFSACAFFYIGSLHMMQKFSPSYSPLSKSINLAKEKQVDLTLSIAHEYTHHVQQLKLEDLKVLSKKESIFREGHAIGVTHYLAEIYADVTNNEGFLFKNIDRNVGEYKSAYIWICKKLGLTPRKSLLKYKNSRDRDEKISRVLIRKPTAHALGNALLSVYEAENGAEIYKDMIHGKFKFY